MSGQYRLAILTSHPIQYQVPLFRALAARPELDLHVFFCCRRGLEPYNDPGFQMTFFWDRPLLEGYRHTFLRNLSPYPDPSRFSGLVNLGVLAPILQGHFDALWIQGWALVSNWIAWAGAAARHVPVLLRGESNGLSEPAGLKGTMKWLILRLFFSQIAGFLAIGTRNADFYKSYGISEKAIFWTPYTVDNDFFIGHARAIAGQKALLRKKHGLPIDLPMILFCGKFLTQKRPLDLLRAFALFRNQLEASLVFVGEGPLKGEMERFIAERRLANVYFLGFRNQGELPACYAMADVFVLPSGFEPWGLVVNEAMCFGLPVIASNQVGAAADLVRHGENGFRYTAGDVDALAVHLQGLLRNPERACEMGQRSLNIISTWNYKACIQGVLDGLAYVTARSREKTT